MTCVFAYEAVARIAVHHLKYQGERHLASVLIAITLETGVRLPEGDLVVPIPLHAARLRQRGYNQASLLGRDLACRLDVPCRDAALIRTRDTPSQVSLPAAQRWRNVHDSFRSDTASVRGKRVILVDDVATTTSTLRAAALVLRDAGAVRVDAFVIARA
jgi:ComF family protein